MQREGRLDFQPRKLTQQEDLTKFLSRKSMTKIPKEFLFETCNELYIEKDTRFFCFAHEMNLHFC